MQFPEIASESEILVTCNDRHFQVTVALWVFWKWKLPVSLNRRIFITSPGTDFVIY